MNKNNIPIFCYANTRSLIGTINYTKVLTRKRLKVDVYLIREMIEKPEIETFM